MKNVIILLFLVLLFNSCKKEDDVSQNSPNQKLNALFSYEIEFHKDSPNIYRFKNLSTGATKYKWYFGNGDSSESVNPICQYQTLDSFRVVLKAINGEYSESFNKLIFVTNISANDSTVIPRPQANFNIYYNTDTPKTIYFKNLSSNYVKSYWDFGDQTISTEKDPTHTYSLREKRKIKLIVEDRYHQRDSLTIEAYLNEVYDALTAGYFLTNTNPITYLFQQPLSYVNTITHISFTDKYQENPDVFGTALQKTFTNLNSFSYITYKKTGNITIYKKKQSKDFSNISSILSSVVGPYNFYSRYSISGNSTSPIDDTTYFNDTTLNLNLVGSTKLELKDTKLNHIFVAYPCSESENNEYVFKIDDRSSQIYGNYNSTIIKLPIDLSTIYIYKISQSGTKIVGTSKIYYSGNR